jgi:HAD superfamily hydrolase (TIGR01509 family)
MSQLQALIFDVDGTLADNERDGHRVAFNRAFAEYGLDWHWDIPLYGELLQVTGGKERMRFFVERYLPEGRFSAAELDALILALHPLKTRHYGQIIRSGELPLRPGVERLIREARAAGIRLGIATTSVRENVVALIESTLGAQAVSWFDVIAAGDVVPNKKPAPDVYRYALAELGLTAADCLAVEDSDNGLRAALAAGIATLVTVNGDTCEQNFDGAALVVDQLGEPDAPFAVLHGNAGDARWVDCALLRRLHAHST